MKVCKQSNIYWKAFRKKKVKYKRCRVLKGASNGGSAMTTDHWLRGHYGISTNFSNALPHCEFFKTNNGLVISNIKNPGISNFSKIDLHFKTRSPYFGYWIPYFAFCKTNNGFVTSKLRLRLVQGSECMLKSLNICKSRFK